MSADKSIKITIVIPSYNRKAITLNCLDQLRSLNRQGMDVAVVVVDDASTDGTGKAIATEYPEAVVLSGSGNLWWSGATNKGVVWALEHGSDYVLTLNDDVSFESDFLEVLLNTSKSNSNSIACGVVCDKRENKILSAGKFAKDFMKTNYHTYLQGSDMTCLPEKEYEMGIGCGCAVLIPVSVFREVGIYDDSRFPHHMGDMDLLLRAKKNGFKIIINPKVIIYTEIGHNYFHSQIVKESMLLNIKAFFDIKSTSNLRVRYFFYKQHAPYHLGWLVFTFYILKMMAILVVKLILPNEILYKIVKRRKNIPI